VINRRFARRFLGQVDPIGEAFQTVAEPGYPETLYSIIGVVEDTSYGSLREDPPAIAFAATSQHPNPQPWATVILHSSGPLGPVTAGVRERVAAISPEIATDTRVFSTLAGESVSRERLMAWLSGFYGLLGAALAVIGLWGVMSYWAVKRLREFGIRLAIGAPRYEPVHMMLRETVVMLLTGFAVGIAVALVIARSAAALLYGLRPADPLTLAGSAVALTLIAAASSCFPAIQASRTDPLDVLRSE
jgi:hypothetical protein